MTELREAARRAERYGFAALAEQAHRRVGELVPSAKHARLADRWRARIIASVEGPLRERLG